MKTKAQTLIAGCIVFISMAINSIAQTTVKSTVGDKKAIAIDKKKVPTIIIGKLLVEFPDILEGNWYTHPVFDSKSDWYIYNPTINEYEHHDNYAVEFVKEKTPYKIVYSKIGDKLVTHRGLSTDLPKAVTEAVHKSKYTNWALSDSKEEIFDDQANNKAHIYRVEVVNGKEKHHLYYLKTGELVKDKTVI